MYGTVIPGLTLCSVIPGLTGDLFFEKTAEGVLPVWDVNVKGVFDFGFVQDGVERTGGFDRVLPCLARSHFTSAATDSASFRS